MEETKNKTKQKTVFICLSVQEGKMWIKKEGYSTVFVSLFQKMSQFFSFFYSCMSFRRQNLSCVLDNFFTTPVL